MILLSKERKLGPALFQCYTKWNKLAMKQQILYCDWLKGGSWAVRVRAGSRVVMCQGPMGGKWRAIPDGPRISASQDYIQFWKRAGHGYDLHDTAMMWANEDSDGKVYAYFITIGYVFVFLFLVFWDKVSFCSSHWSGTQCVPRRVSSSARSSCFCLLSTGITYTPSSTIQSLKSVGNCGSVKSPLFPYTFLSTMSQPTNQQVLLGECPVGEVLAVQSWGPEIGLFQHPSKSQIRHLEFVTPMLERWKRELTDKTT